MGPSSPRLGASRPARPSTSACADSGSSLLPRARRRERRRGHRTRPRVAIAGIHIESSTFSPHRSGRADFTVVRGDDLLARYDGLPRDVEWIPLVHARALPGGAVERDFYDSIKSEILEGL